MTRPANMPDFFAAPEPAWIHCDDVRFLGANEVACSVPRLTGGLGLVITTNAYFDKDLKRVMALIIGTVPPVGKLADFPSGDRIAVPENVVEPLNGSTV